MYKNILVPVIIGEDHDQTASFIAAQSLADEGAEFTVLHVMESIPSYVLNEIPSELVKTARQETETALKAAATRLPGATTVLLSGHAGRSILDYAEDHDIDCIVIASHVPGLSNLFLGSTADRVVRHAKCAVHVLR